MAARLSALRAGRTLPPGFFIFKDSWYSFLLDDESTPGPQCGPKDQVNGKVKISLLQAMEAHMVARG
jgi:hypothetical protein